MPLYPLPWQDPKVFCDGKERSAFIGWLSSRLMGAQDHLADLRKQDPNGLRPGAEAVVADMLALKTELEALGFIYTIPDHLKAQYDENFAPLARPE